MGLALALFGIYGVIAHAVAQQTREIGIRMALGATLGEVVGMVLRVGVRLLAIGIGVGLAASLASVKLLAGLVRVSTFDPYNFRGRRSAGVCHGRVRQLLAGASGGPGRPRDRPAGTVAQPARSKGALESIRGYGEGQS